jgi:superfamily II DNA or RNA helicase
VTASRSASQSGPAQRTPQVVNLRDYQARLLDDYDPEHDTLIEQPTGSGKTLMIVAMVPRLLVTSFDNILIIAPQTQIEGA